MVLKTLLIIMVILVLTEDTASIKKSPKEEKEDRELAEAVNRTLAEEEKKRKDEENIKEEDDEAQKEEEDEKKENSNQEGTRDGNKEIGQNVTCPTLNSTCPVVECPAPVKCPEPRKCPAPTVCPEVEPCEPCGPCPPIHCQPCPVCNNTSVASPEVVNVTTNRLDCPSESASPAMTVPVAMIVGAITSLLITGTVAILGLLLRYAHPFVSGFLFLFLVALTWYLSSHYPETARELGGRAWTALQDATFALGHRVMEAIQRHHDQVVFSVNSILL
jgi:hypothetical protein